MLKYYRFFHQRVKLICIRIHSTIEFSTYYFNSSYHNTVIEQYIWRAEKLSGIGT
jgi:hypothetical protein